MKTGEAKVQKARMRLVEAGGRAAQDFGFSRILGQIVAYLYLSAGERSLDEIEADLHVSKAATSGASPSEGRKRCEARRRGFKGISQSQGQHGTS
jgi:hypothetical protein